MTDYGGVLADLFSSHLAKLNVGQDTVTRGGAADIDTPDTIIPIDNVRVGISHPENRVTYGTKRTYFHAEPDIELSFQCKGSADIPSYFQTRATRDSTSGFLPIHTWQFELSTINSTAEKKTVTFNGQLRDYGVTRQSEDMALPILIDAFIRVVDDKVTVSA